MEPQITEQCRALQEAARQFTAQRLLPLETQLLADARLPDSVVAELEAALGAAGLDRADVPESLGGGGLGLLGKCLVQEELSYSIVGTQICLEENLHLLSRYASGPQHDQYVRSIARGELRSCFALTEPEAGSDMESIRTTASRSGAHYVVDGHKAYVRGASRAGVILVLAQTSDGDDRGLAAWLVSPNDPGVQLTSRRQLLSTEPVCDLILSGCRLPPDRMLGGIGAGLAVVASRLQAAELLAAARCSGMARRCLDLALQHVQRRVAFGGPLSELQIVQHHLADRATELHAARLLTIGAASRLDAGQSAEGQIEAAKVCAAETARCIADTTVQLHGAQGCVVGTLPEFLYRASRVGLIANLPAELHRIQVARAVLERWGGRAA